jgi:UDP-N-acetylglucosamine transferase subunit ALG13
VTPTTIRPLLLVTVGTDHHPFDRLIRWTDGWLTTTGSRWRCLMQIGTSTPPSAPAVGHAYLEFEALQAAMREAAVIVCHGGPGTILGARQAGAKPVVVPRQPRLGEHVDDHQVLFARRLAAAGSVFLAETEAELRALLDRVVVDPAAFRTAYDDLGMEEAVRSFQLLVDDLVVGPQPRLSKMANPGSEGVTP